MAQISRFIFCFCLAGLLACSDQAADPRGNSEAGITDSESDQLKAKIALFDQCFERFIVYQKANLFSQKFYRDCHAEDSKTLRRALKILLAGALSEVESFHRKRRTTYLQRFEQATGYAKLRSLLKETPARAKSEPLREGLLINEFNAHSNSELLDFSSARVFNLPEPARSQGKIVFYVALANCIRYQLRESYRVIDKAERNASVLGERGGREAYEREQRLLIRFRVLEELVRDHERLIGNYLEGFLPEFEKYVSFDRWLINVDPSESDEFLYQNFGDRCGEAFRIWD